MADAFDAAMVALEDRVSDTSRLSEPFLAVFPVSGVAVSTMGDLLGTETVSATDDGALELDELQFDLGEGPCWDAVRTAAPSLEPALATAAAQGRWPAFGRAAIERDVSSIFAFPLMLGGLRFGAIDLYSRKPLVLDRRQTRQASVLAAVVSRRILREAVAEIEGVPLDDMSPFSRRRVHQATGMIIAQLDIDADDARLVLEGHAFAVGRSMMGVADEVLAGRLRFSKDDGAIEATQ